MIQAKKHSDPGLVTLMPEVIRDLDPLNSLPLELQKKLVKQSELIPYPAGQTIFRQGDKDDHVFYLLEGKLQLECDGQMMKTVEGGSDEARYRLSQLRPRQMTAKAVSDVTLFRTSRTLLESLLDEVRNLHEADFEVHDLEEEDDDDWMSILLNSPLFSRISAANIQMVFSRMESIPVKAGEIVICQGEPGDYYYIIKSGKARVTRRSPVGMKDIVLAQLDTGDCFGEEALIANAIRSASVTMDSDGELMRLNREHFAELLLKPILKGVNNDTARVRVSEGAVWLDVRSTQAHAEKSLENSLNLPLPLVRAQHRRLDENSTYIACCDDGSLAAVAAFILINLGYDVYFLETGLNSISPTPVTETARPSVEPANLAPDRGATVLADVRAAALDSELSRANIRLQEAARLEKQAELEGARAKQRAEAQMREQELKLKEQEQRINESLSDAVQMKHELELAREKIERDMEEKLRLEREKIEHQNLRAKAMLDEAEQIKQEIAKAKQIADQQSNEAHVKVEQRIREIETQAERNLEVEREKLQQIAARNTQELEHIKQLKQEAEARLIEERREMSRTVEENRQQLSEVQRMKEVMQAAQKAAEKQLEQQQLERIRKEEALQRKMRAEVLAERRRLEQEFANNSQLLEQAQKDKQTAEETRIAANREAQAIVEEYRREHEAAMKEQEQRLQEQRKELEVEASRIQQMLLVSRTASRDAGLAVQRAEQDLERLQATKRLLEKQATGDSIKQQIGKDIASTEERLHEASDQLRSARRVHADAESAQENNRLKLDQQQEAEEGLRQQLEADLQEWITEQTLHANSDEQRSLEQRQREEMQRILARAEQASKDVKQHDLQLINELSMQFDLEDD